MKNNLVELVRTFDEYAADNFPPNPPRLWSLYRSANTTITETSGHETKVALVVTTFILRNAAEKTDGGEITVDDWQKYTSDVFPIMTSLLEAISTNSTEKAPVHHFTMALIDLNWPPETKN